MNIQNEYRRIAQYSTKTIKVEFKTNVLRLRRELGKKITRLRDEQSQHCIVAHTSGSNLQLAAETCEFSRKFHRCPWDFNVPYPHFY